ncbi:MAG: CPXCG motif-containing cysteine-rich protein [Vicinamibacterales bacterium]
MDAHTTSCPYCGESLEILVDESVRRQTYVEDCQVCCKPMVVRVTVHRDGEVDLSVSAEDD